MDFFDRVGKMALGSRLRRLSETIAQDAAEVYKLQGLSFEPKWFPVFYVLHQDGELSVTEIAERIGHSHPSVSQIARSLRHHGLISHTKDKRDGRKTVLSLTDKGRSLIPDLELLFVDVRRAVDELLQETYHDIWKAIQDLEYALNQKSLLQRAREVRKEREATHVRIIDYLPRHHRHFRALNLEWINKYFMLEPADLKALDNPEEFILGPGGHIFMACYKEEIVGTCAMIKLDETTYELAKMAVSPAAQGKSIGWKLGLAVIDKARQLGAGRLYLESNTRLTPAINLYHKLGFKKVTGPPSPYERANIQMELLLVL